MFSARLSSCNLGARYNAPAERAVHSEYAQKFGRTLEEIHQYFVREQEVLAELYSRSCMPKLLLQNDGLPDNAADEAWSFWTEEIQAGESMAKRAG